jgi:hypothetical protein
MARPYCEQWLSGIAVQRKRQTRQWRDVSCPGVWLLRARLDREKGRPGARIRARVASGPCRSGWRSQLRLGKRRAGLRRLSAALTPSQRRRDVPLCLDNLMTGGTAETVTSE